MKGNLFVKLPHHVHVLSFLLSLFVLARNARASLANKIKNYRHIRKIPAAGGRSFSYVECEYIWGKQVLLEIVRNSFLCIVVSQPEYIERGT